ncbi:hypothetical protein HYN48_14125 [Flavobacterium magnum]|uniref:Uncharacterized protein n=1 Tax=Flavobacterium magnum TaxID=2162713 RepID=A0A2S0RGR5_9FLAO|nr:hypothetical protein [Flavobacterium magnum]AWA31137.1 hypothetical protein HYN48_14125 [Flavobacterium magnum]
MKTTSKLNRFLIPASLLLTVVGFGMIIFMLTVTDEKAKQLPIGPWVFICLFCSAAISTALLVMLFLKHITIDENSVSVKYLFRKKLEYSFEEITGYNEYENFSSTGNYMTFHFKTNDDKIHMFSTLEFRNYSQISSMISQKTTIMNIGKFHNLLKGVSILLIVMAIIGTLIIFKLSSNGS